MMSLGSLIAKARKDAGLSLEDLAAKTNIRMSVLSEIEKDNFSQCGGETYARGHVRNIASILNADQKEFIRLYEEEQGGETRSMKDLLIENSVMRLPAEARKVSWKVLVIISVASLFVVGIAQVVISNINTNDVLSANPTASASPSETAAQSPSAEPSTQSTFSTGSGVEVIIEAVRAKSWLFVSDAAGRILFSGQVSRGAVKTFSSDSQLNLKVGNAGGVDLKVNGKKVQALGVDGEVVSVSYGVDS
ncbi:membrane protein [Actinomycetes bacterium]|nr:membrane protein [Actinomycetes bacterium]